MSDILSNVPTDAIREALRESGASAWLIYDYRNLNPVFADVFGDRNISRRAIYLIPVEGNPTLLVHAVDADKFPGIVKKVFTDTGGLTRHITDSLGANRRVMMEYSPGGLLPVMSYVDAGTFELLTSIGLDIHSSADLYQYAFARWTADDLADHERVSARHGLAIQEAFDFVGQNLGRVREGEVIAFLRDLLGRDGIEIAVPCVAANAHSGMPHYELAGAPGDVIGPGDWLMIDTHARLPGRVFADITWMGFAGTQVPAAHQKAFDTVLAARDLAVETLMEGWQKGCRIEGWELDRVARDYIIGAGYGPFFTHRLGHSLGRGIHGRGANLDDLESHDTRPLIPHTAFTIEPGIYTPDFGVRSEINVYIDDTGPRITTPIQRAVRSF